MLNEVFSVLPRPFHWTDEQCLLLGCRHITSHSSNLLFTCVISPRSELLRLWLWSHGGIIFVPIPFFCNTNPTYTGLGLNPSLHGERLQSLAPGRDSKHVSPEWDSDILSMCEAVCSSFNHPVLLKVIIAVWCKILSFTDTHLLSLQSEKTRNSYKKPMFRMPGKCR